MTAWQDGLKNALDNDREFPDAEKRRRFTKRDQKLSCTSGVILPAKRHGDELEENIDGYHKQARCQAPRQHHRTDCTHVKI